MRAFAPEACASGGYAVLARVSPGYPPLEGRLPTCYSPVRHFTQADVLRHPPFLVRLACVRHAASVDSEPGSNSRLNLARAPTPSARKTRRPLGMETAWRVDLFELSLNESREGSGQPPGKPEDHPRRSAGALSLQTLRQSTWQAQLRCQRAIAPDLRRDPQLGRDRQPLAFRQAQQTSLSATLWEKLRPEQFLILAASS